MDGCDSTASHHEIVVSMVDCVDSVESFSVEIASSVEIEVFGELEASGERDECCAMPNRCGDLYG